MDNRFPGIKGVLRRSRRTQLRKARCWTRKRQPKGRCGYALSLVFATLPNLFSIARRVATASNAPAALQTRILGVWQANGISGGN
jgi:hypothetical protein